MSSELLYTLEHFSDILKEVIFINFYFMHNISLYPLICKQRFVFNILTAHILSIFRFHAFESFNIHSIDAGLRIIVSLGLILFITVSLQYKELI